MTGNEVISSFIQEQGFFRPAFLPGMRASWLEQASLIQIQRTMFFF
jgi:hypothetical protein